MPRKSNKKTSKSTKKKSLWSRAYNARFSMKDITREIWRLKGLVNSEMYKLDTAWSSVAMTTGAVSNVVGVAQGDGDNQRSGNSIFVRNYNFKGSIVHNAAGSNTQFVRVSVVMDTQQVGDTNPAYTDIYESASPYAHLNSNTVGRFKVLYSRIITVNNNDKTSSLVSINLPMRHHVRYNGTAGTDLQKGGIFFCSSVDEPTANMPTISGEHRTSYHDN